MYRAVWTTPERCQPLLSIVLQMKLCLEDNGHQVQDWKATATVNFCWMLLPWFID
jgi:hypothetical protein